MSDWTAADVPSQQGRVAVVTGANSGLGLVTARELARAGARVVMACRDLTRGERALMSIRSSVPDAEVALSQLDLADLGSVRKFADSLDSGLDVLVNNAGVMAMPKSSTADGFEMHLGTNHLGHFALTGLVLEHLLARPDPRVVTVSSQAHRTGRIDFDDLQSEKRYGRWTAYGQSKLANLLFAFELQRRAAAAGSSLRSVAAHPGYAATNLQFAAARSEGSSLRERLMGFGNRIFSQSDEMGALPILYAATVVDLPGGSYVGPDGMFEQKGHPTIVGSSKRSKDEDEARRLWDISEELTGVRYSFF
jgi:NAD(P)-dependent dehydrogenase (short-subunit alcohol dehydrogenase family)